MDFYRVHNFDPAAPGPGANGHPLFLWPRQGGGRIDDPAHEYLVLYLSSSAEGAVAETFGTFSEWTNAILDPPPSSTPGMHKALVRYEGDPGVVDLDDPSVLLDLGLRPSQVVARDYASTQEWARRIYDQGAFAGVSWWSCYGPQWATTGLWDTSGLTVADVTPLTLDHPAVLEASRQIHRIISRKRH